jgi:hypothetical protein
MIKLMPLNPMIAPAGVDLLQVSPMVKLRFFPEIGMSCWDSPVDCMISTIELRREILWRRVITIPAAEIHAWSRFRFRAEMGKDKWYPDERSYAYHKTFLAAVFLPPNRDVGWAPKREEKSWADEAGAESTYTFYLDEKELRPI